MEPTEREISNVRRALGRLRAEPAGWGRVRSGLATAPTVRDVQLVQARRALPWAARVIGLPPPR